MAKKLSNSSFCVRIVLSPPAVSAVPVAASVIRAYCLSALGNAMTGLDTKEFFKMQNVSIASLGKGPPLYLEFLHVSLNSEAAMMAKFLIWVRKNCTGPQTSKFF